MFITPDTIIPDPSNPQSLNRYSYCYNNPVIYLDPSGHWRIGASLHLGIGGHFQYDSDNGFDVGVGGGFDVGASFGDGNWGASFQVGGYVDAGYNSAVNSATITGSYGGVSGTMYLNHGEFSIGGSYAGLSAGYSSFGSGSWSGGFMGASYNFSSGDWSYSANLGAIGEKINDQIFNLAAAGISTPRWLGNLTSMQARAESWLGTARHRMFGAPPSDSLLLAGDMLSSYGQLYNGRPKENPYYHSSYLKHKDPLQIDEGLFMTGFLSTTDGMAMSGSWAATTLGAGSVHPGFGIWFAFTHSPALYWGLYDMKHGIQLMGDSFYRGDGPRSSH